MDNKDKIKKNVYIGADHNGFNLKNRLIEYYRELYNIIDCGPLQYDKDDDYPDFAASVANKVKNDSNSVGILICKSGVGVCIVANKFDGIRAVNTDTLKIAVSSRLDDDTNVLCLASSELDFNTSIPLINKWMNTEFSSHERHIRRLNKIQKIENEN